MSGIRISISKKRCKNLQESLQQASNQGNFRSTKRILAILAVGQGKTYETIARVLGVCEESIRLWIKDYLLRGNQSFVAEKSPGRPPKLTKRQKKELAKWIENGPEALGFTGGCWRSPMIQHLIFEKFGVFYSVTYIAQLLKNMGFSYQKAKFVSDHLDEKKRGEWLQNTWPEVLALAQRKNAHILFGDEASFPQWGTLSYTWAPRGQQPVVKTSGKRKGYKVFGLIEYFTGRFFSQTTEEKLNSQSYQAFLKGVLAKTRKHLIIIQDGAKYHISKAMKKFFELHKNRITVYQLPSYSPDYNPIEKLWKKIKEKGIHLHHFPTFQDLMDKVEEMLICFENAEKEILKLFGFYNKLNSAA